jgi:hypothetical protein
LIEALVEFFGGFRLLARKFNLAIRKVVELPLHIQTQLFQLVASDKGLPVSVCLLHGLVARL